MGVMLMNQRVLSYRKIVMILSVISLSSFYISYDLTRLFNKPKTEARISPPIAVSSLHRGILTQLRRLESQKDEVISEKKLQTIFKEIDEEKSNSSVYTSDLVLIKGDKFTIQKNNVYLVVLQNLGIPYRIAYSNNHASDQANEIRQLHWTLLICMMRDDKDVCLDPDQHSELDVFQKVSEIPELRGLQPRMLNELLSAARKIQEIQSVLGIPLSFSLPNQKQLFINIADVIGQDYNWLVSSTSSSGIQMSLYTSEDILQKLNNDKISMPAIIHHFRGEPFQISDQEVFIRLFVVVTNLQPLRVLMHKEGIVFFYEKENGLFIQISKNVWPFSQFLSHVMTTYGENRALYFEKKVSQLIATTMLLFDNSNLNLYKDNTGEKIERCTNCYQLLSFDIAVNSSLHPFMIRVNLQPELPYFSDDAFPSYFYREMATDLIQLTRNYSMPNLQLISGFLEAESEYVGILGHNCLISHELCLTKRDISNMLKLKYEMESEGFSLLYPSPDMLLYSSILEGIHDNDLISENQPLDLKSRLTQHSTRDTHQAMSRFVNYFQSQSKDKTSLSLAVPWHVPGLASHSTNLFYLSNMTCDQDFSTIRYLRSINFTPKLSLSPPFSPTHMTYQADVPHDVIFIEIIAVAANCQGQARIEDKFGPSDAVNYTLGLGENKVNIFIVDLRHSQPKIVNTYSVLLKRASLPAGSVNLSFDHSVCGLVQDCDMRISSKQICGLHEERVESFQQYRQRKATLPICNNGDREGRWVLPCRQCEVPESCDWDKAEWQPYSCQYSQMKTEELRQCLAGKKLLFLGDSTNRGIFYYLIERINGSIFDWDKTHGYKSYSDVNEGRSHMAFAYYPQFWLPSNKRPVFDQSLYQLFLKSGPVRNDSSTVLVVGGVQWLSTQHLHMLLSVLKREKLQGIRVFVKSLGSGFHTPSQPKSSYQDQERLLAHTKSITEYAQQHGLEVIDTFNITMARYKDFMEGKCACHFHKVLEETNVNNRSMYRVEGSINAAYSEILLSLLCSYDSSHLVMDRLPT